jgi:hypothetical protein
MGPSDPLLHFFFSSESFKWEPVLLWSDKTRERNYSSTNRSLSCVRTWRETGYIGSRVCTTLLAVWLAEK